jgi:hypothetical protein
LLIDNPTERQFFRGYTVRFNTGGGNTVYAGVPQSRLSVGTFEYFTNGAWFASGTGGNPTLRDVDTKGGMQIRFTLTSADTFNLVMTPLDNPAMAYSKSGTLEGPSGAPIDWVEFELFNTDSDWYPSATPTSGETDFYIRSMQIFAGPLRGDFDADFDVDLTDYLNLAAHLHTDVSALTTAQSYVLGDMTRDLRIDGHDYRDFRFAYDDVNGVGAFVAMLTAVPEPAAGSLAAIGWGVVAGLMRRRSSCTRQAKD